MSSNSGVLVQHPWHAVCIKNSNKFNWIDLCISINQLALERWVGKRFSPFHSRVLQFFNDQGVLSGSKDFSVQVRVTDPSAERMGKEAV